MSLYSESEVRDIINTAVANTEMTDAQRARLGVVDEQTDLARFGNVLFDMPEVRNGFVSTLYNQFIYNAVKANIFTSAFDHFRERRDAVGFGTYETHVNPIFPVAYDMKAFNRILQFWETEVFTQYFAINRSQTFPQSLNNKVLRQAFYNYSAFDSFLEQLIMAPRNGNTVIETNAIKGLINSQVQAGIVKTKIIESFSSEEDYKNFASIIQADAVGMCAEPSPNYNAYGDIPGAEGQAWTQSRRDDLCLIASSDVLAKVKTYVLAFAFNQDDIDFKFTFIPLATWNYKPYNEETRTFGNEIQSNLLCVLCDGGWIKLEDNFDEELQDTNCMTAGIQRALQIDQTYSIRAFRNAIAYIDGSAPAPASKAATITPNKVEFTATTDSQEFEVKDAESKTVTNYKLSYSAIKVTNSDSIPINKEETDAVFKVEKTETGTVNVSVQHDYIANSEENFVLTLIIDNNITAAVFTRFSV